jgi:hypothetical protein
MTIATIVVKLKSLLVESALDGKVGVRNVFLFAEVWDGARAEVRVLQHAYQLRYKRLFPSTTYPLKSNVVDIVNAVGPQKKWTWTVSLCLSFPGCDVDLKKNLPSIVMIPFQNFSSQFSELMAKDIIHVHCWCLGIPQPENGSKQH